MKPQPPKMMVPPRLHTTLSIHRQRQPPTTQLLTPALSFTRHAAFALGDGRRVRGKFVVAEALPGVFRASDGVPGGVAVGYARGGGYVVLAEVGELDAGGTDRAGGEFVGITARIGPAGDGGVGGGAGGRGGGGGGGGFDGR
jgi:hypothetical protein